MVDELSPGVVVVVGFAVVVVVELELDSGDVVVVVEAAWSWAGLFSGVTDAAAEDRGSAPLAVATTRATVSRRIAFRRGFGANEARVIARAAAWIGARRVQSMALCRHRRPLT